MKTAFKAALLLSSALVGAPALAQTPLYAPPPQFYSLDARGVDVISGRAVRSATLVSIGDPNGLGLSYSRTYFNGYWRDNVTGTLTTSGPSNSIYTLSIGGSTDVFTKSGTTFTPNHNVGQTLTQSGSTYIYTMPDGAEARFSQNLSDRSMALTRANGGRLTQIKRPNGETISYFYEIAEEWGEVQGAPPEQLLWATRLRSVNSNSGYSLFLEYELEEGPDYLSVGSWQRLAKVTAFNRAQCAAPSDMGCAAGTVWPSATFSGANVTDQSGRTTYYGNAGPANTLALRTAQNPTTDVVKYTMDANQRIISAETAGHAWTYAYGDASGVRTTSITAPGGAIAVATSSLGVGLLSSYKDELNRTTSYLYDSSSRLTKVTLPATNSVSYAYDARGNLILRTVAPPSLIIDPPPSIVTSATYPTTCTNRITCNAPLTTRDEREAVTDYTYDPVHGGLTSVTAPAPTAGAVRPQTRLAYEARQAQIADGAGGFTPASPIILPVSSSTCATGVAPTCVGTVDETRTTVAYGATGVANNLHPTAVTQAAGDGSLSASTTLTYTANGDVASVDGPLAGSEDTTYYRYDAARQPVGVVGPDPDGPSGSLMRRAQRVTYDAAGRATQVERGAVNGITDGDWSGFVSLQQQLTAYDAYGRPVITAQHGGGQAHAVTHIGYDAAGRTACVAQRMNPAAFNSLPGSACDLGAQGAYGPDRIVKYEYDAASQLTKSISGYGTTSPITEEATYTANGKPLTLKDGAGNVSTMVYDGFDRVSRMNYPEATTGAGASSASDYEQYGYDAGSNVVSYRNRAGETEARRYDALNRVVSVVRSAAPSTAWTYDNLNRPLTLSGAGIVQGYGWDGLGRQTHETTPLGTMNYGYDLAGRRTWLSWPDGFWAAYDYNYANDLMTIRENGATTWQLASWAYDNLGRPIAQGRANGATTYWTYDGASRLTALTQDLAGTANDVTLNFAYNPAGQIVTRTLSNSAYAYAPGAGNTAYVNNGRNQVTSVNGAGVGYDGRQNIASVPGLGSYGYNGSNELTSATVGGTTTGLSYDPGGRLYQSGSTRFLYDGQQVVGEYDASGGLLRRYVPGLGLDNVVTAYEGAVGYDRRYPVADERGSVVSITDGAANALATNTYDEYGQPGAGNAGRFQYTGQMWLPEAQLYHYRARAYAPQLGRFMQTDPIGYAAGANVYAYVGGDPVNWSDPLGLQQVDVPCPEIGDDTYDCGTIGPVRPGQDWPDYVFHLGRGVASFVGRGAGTAPGGLGARFPGAGFSGSSIQNDPTYGAYNEARTRAMNSNSWMAIPVLAPGAVVIGLEVGAAAGASAGGKAAGSLFGRLCNCFVGDTEVQTADGLKSIEQIAVGDRVLARDDATGETALRPVVALIAGGEREIWEVTVETIDAQGRVQREPIGTTDEHPWRTVGGAWLETKDLTPGTELVSADGDRSVVITVLKTDRIEATYNFEVEGFHTYFVGESQVWVHNACPVNLFSEHALARMAQRGVTPSMARNVIQNGSRFFDPRNGSVVSVIRGGMASGKDIGVAVGAFSGRVTTVMVNSGMIRPNWIPIP